MGYRVFKRKPWRRVRGSLGMCWVPNSGARKLTIRYVDTIDEARQMCDLGPANKARDAGLEYRGLMFYEFESV